nr:hypothetical protein BaRGS_023179 [Batillaria attramentaria]
MTQDFYHYTSKKGLNKILKSGCISESLSGGQDAKFGEGVYGTSLHPDEGKKQIAKNNWGQYWWKNKTSGKVSFVGSIVCVQLVDMLGKMFDILKVCDDNS